jgi:hypothetical protein
MELRYETHSDQAFHWERDIQGPVGHVTKFQISSKDFPKDLQLVNPLITSGSNATTVAGVIDKIGWNGRPGGKLELDFVVSTSNRRELLTLLHSAGGGDLESATVTLGFVVYDYDPLAKKYFKAFHTGGTPITGVIETGSGDHQLEGLDEEEAEDHRAQEREIKDVESGEDEAGKADKKKAIEKIRERYEAKAKERRSRRRDIKLKEARGESTKTIQLTVASTPEADPLSPQVWKVTVMILPPELEAGQEEDIHFAVAADEPLAKQWGYEKPPEDGAPE